MYWKVWKAAQWSYSAWWWPALHYRILTDRPSGERRGKISYYVLGKPKLLDFKRYQKQSCEINTFVLSRSWCLWSTVGRGPKTSPTRQCCETSQRPPTSACASSAPAPCWATWSPRPREIPQSHAGWGSYCTSSHKGVMLADACFPFGQATFTTLHHLASSFLFADTNLLPPAHTFILVRASRQICQSSHQCNSFGRDS